MSSSRTTPANPSLWQTVSVFTVEKLCRPPKRFGNVSTFYLDQEIGMFDHASLALLHVWADDTALFPHRLRGPILKKKIAMSV